MNCKLSLLTLIKYIKMRLNDFLKFEIKLKFNIFLTLSDQLRIIFSVLLFISDNFALSLKYYHHLIIILWRKYN